MSGPGLAFRRRGLLCALRRRGRRALRRTVVVPVRQAAALVATLADRLVRDPQLRLVLATLPATDSPALVIGPARAARQAMRTGCPDVVGTDPADPQVNVVSAAADEHSLPRRWSRVVVTDVHASAARLRAAVAACLPGGEVVIVTRRRSAVRLGNGTAPHPVHRRGLLAAHLVRVPE